MINRPDLNFVDDDNFNNFFFYHKSKNLRITKGLFLESLKSFFIRDFYDLISYSFFMVQDLSFFKTSSFSYLSSMFRN